MTSEVCCWVVALFSEVVELVGVRLYNINKQFLFKSQKISHIDLLQTDLSSFLLIGKNATYGLTLVDLLFPHV